MLVDFELSRIKITTTRYNWYILANNYVCTNLSQRIYFLNTILGPLPQPKKKKKNKNKLSQT